MVDNSGSVFILNHMVEYTADQLDTVFHALSDPTRRGMLVALSAGPSTISDLAKPYEMSLAAASKHVKKLEVAGLIDREVIGRVHHCRLTPEKLKAARDWLQTYERFWNARLDALEAALEANTVVADEDVLPDTMPDTLSDTLPEPANDKRGIDHANDE